MSLLERLNKTVPNNATNFRKLIAFISLFFTAYLLAGSLLANPPEIQQFLKTYCNDCHGTAKQKGDRRFDELVLPAAKVDTLIELKDILDQLNLGDMPPKKAKQPSANELKAFVALATQALTEGREKYDQRLVRTEYGCLRSDHPISAGSSRREHGEPRGCSSDFRLLA
jgi:hypothetical protein